MTQDMRNGDTSKYEEMSREELCAIIGQDLDQNTSRADLIEMAIAIDSDR